MRAFQIVIDRRPQRTVPRAFSALRGVVDVLVDGTNVTARIGQDHALPLLRDLAYAAADLACGRQSRATVRFYDQRDAWAVGLERLGDQALLTVFQGGAFPKVAVHERAVPGEALLRGILQAVDEALETGGAPAPVAADLAAARRLLGPLTWTVVQEEVETVEIRVDPPAEASVGFGAEFSMRTRPASSGRASEVEHNDLHSLLFHGPFRIRVGETRRDLGETFPFPVAETLVREAGEILECWEGGRALNHRFEVAGVFLTTRLSADGKLSVSMGGPRTAGLSRALTFPVVSVPDFVEAVVAFARGLIRPILRNDRSQHQNLRMRALRDASKELTDSLREAVCDDAKINDSPESYRAFADAAPPRSEPPEVWGQGRLRFALAWQASVPGIDLHATFMVGDRVVLGGSRELACVDRNSGHLLWRVPVERGVSISAPEGIARLAPSGLFTFHDLETGEVLLQVKLAARIGGSPAGAVVNAPGLPRLVVLSEGERHISAVDLVSGEVRWRHALGRGRFFKVRRAGRLLVVSSSEPTLTALDVASGETVWRIRDRLRFCRPAAYDNNALFVVTGDAPPVVRGAEVVLALDPWTGVTRWKRELSSTSSALGVPPITAANVVIIAHHDRRGVGFCALDRETGAIRWNLEPGFAPTTSASIVVDSLLIVNGEGGEVAAVDTDSGQVRWRQRCNRADATDTPRNLDPLVRAGALFVPQQALNVMRPEDGELLGTVPTDLVPDLVRVDDRCNSIIVEESGHLAAFTAGARLTLIRS